MKINLLIRIIKILEKRYKGLELVNIEEEYGKYPELEFKNNNHRKIIVKVIIDSRKYIIKLKVKEIQEQEYGIDFVYESNVNEKFLNNIIRMVKSICNKDFKDIKILDRKFIFTFPNNEKYIIREGNGVMGSGESFIKVVMIKKYIIRIKPIEEEKVWMELMNKINDI